MSQTLPARNETAVQKRDRELAEKSAKMRDALLAAVEERRLEIDGFLSVFGIGYDLFLAGLTMFLSKQQRDQPDFFENLNIPSFIEALTRIAMNGLMPDGKEAAIAAYKDNDKGGVKIAQPMFMRDGFVKVLWRTGMIKSINDQVVTQAEYDAERFEYEEGDQGFIRHKLDLMRKDTDPVVAAYCVIKMASGEDMREVVPKDELEKMAKMSRSPARKSWQHQMHRKGAIRRIMGKMPREKGIVQLLAHDDETYIRRGERPEPEETGAPDTASLFGKRAIRRKAAKPAAALAAPTEQPMDLTMDRVEAGEKVAVGKGPADDDQDVARQQEVDNSGAGDTPQGGAGEAPSPAAETPFVLRAIISTKNGLQQFDNVELWFGDIRQKMQTLDGDKLRAFWTTNRPHIEAAGRHGHAPEAMKLVGFAAELGLIGGERE